MLETLETMVRLAQWDPNRKGIEFELPRWSTYDGSHQNHFEMDTTGGKVCVAARDMDSGLFTVFRRSRHGNLVFFQWKEQSESVWTNFTISTITSPCAFSYAKLVEIFPTAKLPNTQYEAMINSIHEYNSQESEDDYDYNCPDEDDDDLFLGEGYDLGLDSEDPFDDDYLGCEPDRGDENFLHFEAGSGPYASLLFLHEGWEHAAHGYSNDRCVVRYNETDESYEVFTKDDGWNLATITSSNRHRRFTDTELRERFPSSMIIDFQNKPPAVLKWNGGTMDQTLFMAKTYHGIFLRDSFLVARRVRVNPWGHEYKNLEETPLIFYVERLDSNGEVMYYAESDRALAPAHVDGLTPNGPGLWMPGERWTRLREAPLVLFTKEQLYHVFPEAFDLVTPDNEDELEKRLRFYEPKESN